MKTALAVGTALTLCLGNAYGSGSCPNDATQYLTGAQIDALVNGKTVCANSASGGWNEAHSGGNVTEWHTNTASDPTEALGTYSSPDTGTAPGTITYNTGGTYTYYVRPDGSGNHVYCTAMGAASGITVNVRAGYQPIATCPSNPDK